MFSRAKGSGFLESGVMQHTGTLKNAQCFSDTSGSGLSMSRRSCTGRPASRTSACSSPESTSCRLRSPFRTRSPPCCPQSWPRSTHLQAQGGLSSRGTRMHAQACGCGDGTHLCMIDCLAQRCRSTMHVASPGGADTVQLKHVSRRADMRMSATFSTIGGWALQTCPEEERC